MKAKSMLRPLVSLILFAMVAPAAALWVSPQEVPGIYAGLFFKADGVKLQDCTPPWLKLNADGTYHWGGESGTYDINSGELGFSGIHSAWGSGKVENNGEISFDFEKEGKRYTVKMFRVSSLN